MEGIDYHKIFSPVVKLVSICIVLALVALLDLELEQLNVKTNFLHGDLDEDIIIWNNHKVLCNIIKEY